MYTLEMNTSLGVFLRQLLQDWPGGFLPLGMLAPWLSYSARICCELSNTKRLFLESKTVQNIREVVCTSPRRTVFYIIISRHMFCNHRDFVRGIFGQEICGSESSHSGSEQLVVRSAIGRSRVN